MNLPARKRKAEEAAIYGIFEQIKGRLVVSCQAYPGDPLEDTEVLRRMALAALGGGAAGLRVNSAEHIAALRRDTSLPIIGIHKEYGPSDLRITPDFAAARALAASGASMIALDCTNHPWPNGDPWQEIVRRIHAELHLPVMADIATIDEALAAVHRGGLEGGIAQPSARPILPSLLAEGMADSNSKCNRRRA